MHIHTIRWSEERMFQVFGFFRKLMRMKTSEYTGLCSILLVLLRISTGGVNFNFSCIASCYYNSWLFVPTSLFSSFCKAVYWWHIHDFNCISFPSGGIPLAPSLLLSILHQIPHEGAASFFLMFIGRRQIWSHFVETTAAVLSFCRGWGTVISF